MIRRFRWQGRQVGTLRQAGTTAQRVGFRPGRWGRIHRAIRWLRRASLS